MTKTFSKIMAVILSLCVMFSVGVMANAQEATFALSGGKLNLAYGDWDDDYVETVEISIAGGMTNLAADVILTVGKGDSLANVKTLAVSGASWSIGTDGTFSVTVPMNIEIDHAETYNFHFPAGTFVNADGEKSEEYTFSVTGNEIIETLEIEEVPVTPIQKLVVWLDNMDVGDGWRDIINFIISILNWFMAI